MRIPLTTAVPAALNAMSRAITHRRGAAGDPPPAGDQGQRQQNERDAERTSVVDHRHQPGDAPRRRMDDLDDGPVDAGVVADDDYATHEGEDGASQARSVASASTSLAVAARGEHHRAPATQEWWLGKRARTLRGVFSHAGPTASRVSQSEEHTSELQSLR